MLKKIKQKIKNKIIIWLGIDKIILENKRLTLKIENMYIDLKRPEYLLENLNALSKNMNNLHSYFGTAVDIHQPNRDNYHGSWAIITVGGKREYLEFIDLNGKNEREIISFLKQFQGRSRFYDSPPMMKRFFEHELR